MTDRGGRKGLFAVAQFFGTVIVATSSRFGFLFVFQPPRFFGRFPHGRSSCRGGRGHVGCTGHAGAGPFGRTGYEGHGHLGHATTAICHFLFVFDMRLFGALHTGGGIHCIVIHILARVTTTSSCTHHGTAHGRFLFLIFQTRFFGALFQRNIITVIRTGGRIVVGGGIERTLGTLVTATATAIGCLGGFGARGFPRCRRSGRRGRKVKGFG